MTDPYPYSMTEAEAMAHLEAIQEMAISSGDWPMRRRLEQKLFEVHHKLATWNTGG